MYLLLMKVLMFCGLIVWIEKKYLRNVQIFDLLQCGRSKTKRGAGPHCHSWICTNRTNIPIVSRDKSIRDHITDSSLLYSVETHYKCNGRYFNCIINHYMSVQWFTWQTSSKESEKSICSRLIIQSEMNRSITS